MRKTLPKLLLSITILFCLVKPTLAQENEITDESQIVVSGTADETGNLSINLSGDPGDTLKSSTKVTNLSDNTLKIQTELLDFIVESENGVPTFVESGSSIWSMSKWIGIAEEYQEFTLEPNESKDIPFTIDIPTEATPGGHYTSILFTPVIVEEDVTGPLVEHKLGTYVKLTVSGNVEESAEITEFSAPYFSEYGPIPLTLKILNDGNTHFSVSGKVTIKNTFGYEVAEWLIQPGNVFPTAVRLWNTEWKGKWRFGLYKAEVELAYGKEDNSLESEVYFWIIPWKVILILMITIIILIIIGHKKNNKEKQNLSKQKTNLDNNKPKLPSINKLEQSTSNEETI